MVRHYFAISSTFTCLHPQTEIPSDVPSMPPINDFVKLGHGTTFLPGKKDPSVASLIDQVILHGYVILPNLFSPSQVSAANAEIASLEALKSSGPASKGGRTDFEGLNTRRIYALVDKSRVFDCFPIHDTVLKLNDYFLQPNFLITSYHTVNIGPGEKKQAMHTDDGLAMVPRPRPLMGIVCTFCSLYQPSLAQLIYRDLKYADKLNRAP
jgi:hypothetical protein